MTRRHALCCITLMLMILATARCTRETRSTPTQWQGTTSEAVLRASALHTVRPAWAPFPIASPQSVAVAEVHISTTGNVLHVRVLEAPSAPVSQAVVDAVRRWTFRPPDPVNGRAIALTGKLTFYFVRDDEGGTVRYPSEAGYIGRWPSALRAQTKSD